LPYTDPIKKKAYEQRRLLKIKERRASDPEYAAKERARSKKWYDEKFASNPEYRKYRNKRTIASRYGLTVEQYEQKLELQNYKCLICKVLHEDKKGKRLVIDHNHKTYNTDVRGLVCNTCNLGLGMFKDNPEYLRSAAAYLEQKQ
jgi:hypothetical protein